MNTLLKYDARLITTRSDLLIGSFVRKHRVATTSHPSQVHLFHHAVIVSRTWNCGDGDLQAAIV